MTITYIFLALIVLSSLLIVPKDKKILWAGLIITNIIALLEHVMSYQAIIFLSFLFLASQGFSRGNFSNMLKAMLFIIILALAEGFSFHLIPGFNNLLVINKLQLSPESYSFSTYLNFDKVMAALIIFASSNVPNLNPNFKSLKITLFSLFSCLMLILPLAIIGNYVKFEPKLPEVLGIWALNNLLFVSFSEEVFFRGFFQTQLKNMTKSSASPIWITAVIFGLAHFHGGVLYVILSIICGFFYGYAYHRTNSLICSMLVHFGVNFSHFILFTYPALMPNLN